MNSLGGEVDRYLFGGIITVFVVIVKIDMFCMVCLVGWVGGRLLACLPTSLGLMSSVVLWYINDKTTNDKR